MAVSVPTVGDCCFGALDLKWGSIVCAVVTFCLAGGLWRINSDGAIGDNIMGEVVHLLFILGFVGTILLIVGILIDKPELCKLYIIAYALLIVVAILLLIVRVLFSDGKHDHISAIVGTLITVCIVGYCVIVVNSFHKTI